MPDNEAERLRALRSLDLLDTPPDPRFDLFARLAAHLYGTPIALVSLLDADRLWFKATVGLEAPEVPRELAFCAHAILSPGEVTVVDDLTRDARFRGNALVTAPGGLRFYAGAPIVDAAGLPMGTVSVLDRVPRGMDAAGRQRLQDLAAGVSSVLELHRTSIRLHAAATQDSLTGLANPRAFLPLLDAAVANAAAQPCALLYLDLDHFKTLNTRHGHAGGDEVLRETGARLQAALPADAVVARLHGDEFAALLRGEAARNAGVQARRVLAALAEPMRLGSALAPICASIGVASAPGDAAGGAALLHAADTALSQAKEAGGGRAVELHRSPPMLAGGRQAAV